MSARVPSPWRDYRRRRAMLLGAVATAPVFALLRDALPRLAREHPSVSQLLLAVSATSVVSAIVWFAAFRCPWCSRPFHWTWIVANPLSRECVHCGFAKWRDPHAARAYAPAKRG